MYLEEVYLFTGTEQVIKKSKMDRILENLKPEETDIIMIADDGIIIRIFADDISEFARPAKGVRVMKTTNANGETVRKILSVGMAEHDEAEVNDTPDAPDADSAEVTPDEVNIGEEQVVEETEE